MCQESCIKTQLEGDNPSFCGGGGSWYGTCKFADPELVQLISDNEAKGGDPAPWSIMTTDKFRCVSKILFPNPEYANQDVVTCYPKQ